MAQHSMSHYKYYIPRYQIHYSEDSANPTMQQFPLFKHELCKRVLIILTKTTTLGPESLKKPTMMH